MGVVTNTFLSKVENVYVAQYMIEQRGEGRGSIITGSSLHNSRVERAHRDVYSGVSAFYVRIFETMEDELILDISNDVHLFCLHYVYIPRINRSLNEFIQQMNNHPVAGEKNISPLQMWQKGMLENMHSGYSALLPAEVDELGIDPESIQVVDDEDYQVNVVPPEVILSEEELTHLPDPLENDGNCGVDTCKQCVHIISSFQNI